MVVGPTPSPSSPKPKSFVGHVGRQFGVSKFRVRLAWCVGHVGHVVTRFESLAVSAMLAVVGSQKPEKGLFCLIFKQIDPFVGYV